jgi:hypothetical protein
MKPDCVLSLSREEIVRHFSRRVISSATDLFLWPEKERRERERETLDPSCFAIKRQ